MVMGGLITDNKQNKSAGLPLLSRIPIIGGMFGQQTLINNRTELVMFITPRVVESEIDLKNIVDDLRHRMEQVDDAFDVFKRPKSAVSGGATVKPVPWNQGLAQRIANRRRTATTKRRRFPTFSGKKHWKKRRCPPTSGCCRAATAMEPASAQAPQQQPNILFIMGDDIGWFNISAYHQGIMSGRTPNFDKLASQGMRFTDYYAEASCTAGRANFITGELPIRTGMTTVGQAGADIGLPAQAPTIATALKAMGYTTGQFGKNHLGDLNKYLPCVHGFDEFFGYLYHLDAMSDPYWYSYPTDPAIRNAVGPRNLVHCWASDTDDATVDPRWGKVGKQKIVDEGPLAPGPNTGRTPYGGEGEGVGTPNTT